MNQLNLVKRTAEAPEASIPKSEDRSQSAPLSGSVLNLSADTRRSISAGATLQNVDAAASIPKSESRSLSAPLSGSVLNLSADTRRSISAGATLQNVDAAGRKAVLKADAKPQSITSQLQKFTNAPAFVPSPSGLTQPYQERQQLVRCRAASV